MHYFNIFCCKPILKFSFFLSSFLFDSDLCYLLTVGVDCYCCTC